VAHALHLNGFSSVWPITWNISSLTYYSAAQYAVLYIDGLYTSAEAVASSPKGGFGCWRQVCGPGHSSETWGTLKPGPTSHDCTYIRSLLQYTVYFYTAFLTIQSRHIVENAEKGHTEGWYFLRWYLVSEDLILSGRRNKGMLPST
jgi:hypothetical protein